MEVLSQFLAALAFTFVASQLDRTAARSQDEEASIELSFIFITSKNGLFNSSGSRAAVDMALERINRDTTLISGYRLNRTEELDSNCSGITALRQFFSKLRDRQTQYIAVVGAGCSPATEPVAEIVNYYNMPMISYASSAEVLSNRMYYPSYFRTSPSEIVLTPGLANLVHHFGWRQVTFITEEQRLFQDTQAEVTMLLSSRNIAIETRQFSSSRGPEAVQDIFVSDKHMRVFILNMYSLFASQVLCKAYNEGRHYPNYVWITYGWYNSDWWKRSKGNHNCTDGEMLRVLKRSISVVQYPVTNTTEETNTELTGDGFLSEYASRAEEEDLQYTVTAPLAYDAIWTLAFALNTSINALSEFNNRSIPYACTSISDASSKLVPYENFTYSNDLLGCILIENLKITDFTGTSGHVHFDPDGTRGNNSVRIEQYRPVETSESTTAAASSDLQREVVAYLVDANLSQLSYVEGESSSTLWPDGVPPDGIPLNVITTIALPLIIVIQIFAIIGIVFSVFCLGFNIIFRNRKVVRLTSPNLNYLIIIGAFFIYLSVAFHGMPFSEQQLSTVYCNLQQWLFSFGNALCFAVVLAKMGRVYYIFSDPTPNKKSPKDWQLLIAIVLLVGIDVVILLVPTAIPSARLSAELTENRERPPSINDDGVQEVYFFYHCQNSSVHLAWLGVSYAYKLLLQFVAIYFAFQTRKVKVRALNDSKEIAVIIYVTSLILIVLIGVTFAAGSTHPNTSAALSSLSRITYPTIILAFIFIPKMVYLYQDPAGEKIFANTATIASSASGSGGLGGNPFSDGSSGDSGKLKASKEKVANLEKKVQELELVLKEYQQKDTIAEALAPPRESQTVQHISSSSADSDELPFPVSEITLDSSQSSTNIHKALVSGTE